jgi:hypothetical protein
MKPNAISLEYAKATCKIGQGHDCCRYVMGGADGFECARHTDLKDYLDRRVTEKSIIARGDNCPGLPPPVDTSTLTEDPAMFDLSTGLWPEDLPRDGVVLLPVRGMPVLADPGNGDLDLFRALLGGDIELVTYGNWLDVPVSLYCHGEGKVERLMVNPLATILARVMIAGTGGLFNDTINGNAVLLAGGAALFDQAA